MLFFAVAALTFFLDAGTKRLAEGLNVTQSAFAIPGLLEIRLTHNSGMALGILRDGGLAVLLLPLAVITAGWFLLRRYRATVYTRIAAGMIAGGFLGNFLERLAKGYVADMVYFPFLPWFVCNIADIAICAGVGMLVISILFRPEDWREKHAKDEPIGRE